MSIRLFLILALLTIVWAASNLSGDWIFESRAGGTSLRARLNLQEDGGRLSATLWIDNHVLKGEGRTNGTRFAVSVVHADGSGSGHQEQVYLTGKLEGDKIEGSFDNGTERGAWSGRRR